MHGVRAGGKRDLDHLRAVQVATGESDGFVRLTDERSVSVCVRIHGDAANSQEMRSPKHTARHNTAVRDHEGANHSLNTP